MNIKTFVFNPVQENTYLIWDDTKQCAIIDAGNNSASEAAQLEDFIKSEGLKPVVAINTHGHFDHAMGVKWVCERYEIPFAMSSKDLFLLDAISDGDRVYSIEVKGLPRSVDIDLDKFETIKVGEIELQIIKTPGHTPGHVSIYHPESGNLFTGDTLFQESIGRTDLPGGDYGTLMSSIVEQILPLGDEVRVYPGHSGSTTIGHESMYNPFIVEAINGEINYK